MVERFTTIFGSFNKYAQVFNHIFLAVKVVEAQRPQRVLKLFLVFADMLFPYIEIVIHANSYSCCLLQSYKKRCDKYPVFLKTLCP